MGDRFELKTERLTLRVLRRSDIADFTRYRNVDSSLVTKIGRFPTHATLRTNSSTRWNDSTGRLRVVWVQVGMERDGVLVGDIAIWLDQQSELAMIGYTVAPEHQGNSYAVEAASAVLTHLFEHVGVHRVAATIDPRNLASARVLERCGFEYVGTARSSAWSRGEWTDDARFSLLATDWRTWVARPTGAPRTVEFVAVDALNVDAVCAIAVGHSQRRFVRSPAESIADAAHPPSVAGTPLTPWYRAIRADGDIAGILLIATSSANHPTPHLWQLLIDQRHQRRGIARRAIGELARLLLVSGDTQLTASFVDEPGGPESFYRALGFERTGSVDARTRLLTAIAQLADLAELGR